jgi:hypothetical protein
MARQGKRRRKCRGQSAFFGPRDFWTAAAFLPKERKLSPITQPGHGDEHGEDALQRLAIPVDRHSPVHRRFLSSTGGESIAPLGRAGISLGKRS